MTAINWIILTFEPSWALFLPISAIAFDRFWAHDHRTHTHCLKARSNFAVREDFPAFRFAKPLPTVLSIKRSAAAAQQFQITTAY
jgi:hypothetical protein